MALKLDILAGTRAFVDDMKKAGASVEDITDALDELKREGANGTSKLESSFKDLSRQAKKTEADVKDIGTTGGAGLGKIRGATQEVTQEMGQNLGEAVSSVRGDLSDLGQVGQDTLGGLAASLAGAGPAGIVGAAALAAGAVGLGLVTASLQEAEERQARIKEQAGEWADAYVNAADRIVSSSHVVAELQDIATDPERYQTAKDNAKDWGVDVSTAMQAMAGDATSLELVQASLNDKQREWLEILKEGAISPDKVRAGTVNLTDAQREFGDQLDRGTQSLAEQNEAMGLGAEIANNMSAALYNYAKSAGTATGATDDLGNQIYLLPDGKEIVIDAKTGKAYEDIDALEKRTLQPKEVTVRLRPDDTDIRNYRPVQITIPTKLGAPYFNRQLLQ